MPGTHSIQYAPNIEPGALRQKITFQDYTITQDANGGTIQTWNDVYTCRCMIRPMQLETARSAGSSEKFTHDQLTPTQSYLIIIRYAKSVSKMLKPEMRAVYRGIPLVIRSISNVDLMNVEIDIMAENILQQDINV